MRVFDRFNNAWNAFKGRDPTSQISYGRGSYCNRPDFVYYHSSNDPFTTTSIFNKIAVDCSTINVIHARVNEDGKLSKVIKDDLNYALTTSANIDQTGRSLIRDTVMRLLEDGVVALIPVVTDDDPMKTEAYKVQEIRCGKITKWFPRHVEVEVYNDRTGVVERLTLSKTMVAIVENPFHAIMNESNSLTERLQTVLSQLDRTNATNSGGKIDMIIQIPYSTKSDARRKIAEDRRNEIEAQLVGSKYGIAWIDPNEKVIQLNRAIENNLWEQSIDLKKELYNHLGLSQAVFDGTASESEMLNYYSRSIEPIMSAITEEMGRKWLSKTAQTQGQAILFYRDPFKLVPVSQIADVADKFTRNEIMTSNELRSTVGLPPSDDPKANMLINSNLNQTVDQQNQIRNNRENVDDLINRLSK